MLHLTCFPMLLLLFDDFIVKMDLPILSCYLMFVELMVLHLVISLLQVIIYKLDRSLISEYDMT